MMSTHAHKQAVKTEVKDGTSDGVREHATGSTRARRRG